MVLEMSTYIVRGFLEKLADSGGFKDTSGVFGQGNYIGTRPKINKAYSGQEAMRPKLDPQDPRLQYFGREHQRQLVSGETSIDELKAKYPNLLSYDNYNKTYDKIYDKSGGKANLVNPRTHLMNEQPTEVRVGRYANIPREDQIGDQDTTTDEGISKLQKRLGEVAKINEVDASRWTSTGALKQDAYEILPTEFDFAGNPTAFEKVRVPKQDDSISWDPSVGNASDWHKSFRDTSTKNQLKEDLHISPIVTSSTESLPKEYTKGDDLLTKDMFGTTSDKQFPFPEQEITDLSADTDMINDNSQEQTYPTLETASSSYPSYELGERYAKISLKEKLQKVLDQYENRLEPSLPIKPEKDIHSLNPKEWDTILPKYIQPPNTMYSRDETEREPIDFSELFLGKGY